MKVWKQSKRHYKFATLSYWIKKSEQNWIAVSKRVVLRKHINFGEVDCFITGVCLEIGRYKRNEHF